MHIRKSWLPAALLVLAACHHADHKTPAPVPVAVADSVTQTAPSAPDTAFSDVSLVVDPKVHFAAPDPEDAGPDTSDLPIPGDTGRITLGIYVEAMPGECQGAIATDTAALEKGASLLRNSDQRPVTMYINGQVLHFHMDRSKPMDDPNLYFKGHGYSIAVYRKHITTDPKIDHSHMEYFDGVMEVKRDFQRVRLRIAGEWGCGE